MYIVLFSNSYYDYSYYGYLLIFRCPWYIMLSLYFKKELLIVIISHNYDSLIITLGSIPIATAISLYLASHGCIP